MGRFQVERSVTVPTAPPETWDFLVTDDGWRRPFVTAVRALAEGPVAMGSRYENSLRVMGRDYTAVNEVTRVAPPVQLGWRQIEGDGPLVTVEGGYRLDAEGSGTRVTVHLVYETRRAWPPTFLARLVTTRFVIPRQLANLYSALV